MKKIAILTDIHANLFLLKKIIEQLEKENIDDYIFCGDYITDGFENNEVLELIKSISNNVVAGNRELSIVNYDNCSWDNLAQWRSMLYTYKNLSEINKKFITNLKTQLILEIEGKRICVTHGTLKNVREIVLEDSYEIFDNLIDSYNCDIYFFGHSHTPFNVFYKNCYFINSGAVSCLANYSKRSMFGIITIDEESISYSSKYIDFSFEELKSYYLNSDYFKICNEWCNLILYSLKTGKNYCDGFIKYLNNLTNNNEKLNSDLWNEKFIEYMNLCNLEIIK